MTDEDLALMFRLSAIMDEQDVDTNDRLVYLPKALDKLKEEDNLKDEAKN